ncbi:MAG: hypothetical protein Q9227_006763 [Pyrenula ochraceoflavens]
MLSTQYTQVPSHPQSGDPDMDSSKYPSPKETLHPDQPSPLSPPPYTSKPAVQMEVTGPLVSPQNVPGIRMRRDRRRRVDYATTLALIFVWIFLTLGCGLLLYFMAAFMSQDSEPGDYTVGIEIYLTILYSAAPVPFAAILNEVVVDRCWRRVAYSALGSEAASLDNESLAKNLRAANFQWLNLLGRIWRRNTSLQDVRAVASYGLLRWGTAISIASVQFCVTWHVEVPPQDDDEFGLYTANNRFGWVIVPAFLHACTVFGTMAIWFLPPWSVFSSRFDDIGLLDRYEPYLLRVSGGSIATFETIARHLTSDQAPVQLSKINKPGIQFRAKLNGIWFGLGMMCILPFVAWLYTQHIRWNGGMSYGISRFAFHLVFLCQNIFYLLALDFVVWNVSLEGLCRTNRRDIQTPNKNLRHLGYFSGLILFLKAVKQRRPLRSAIFLWLFWFQACIVRFSTSAYSLFVTVLSYGTLSQQQTFYDPEVWLSWALYTVVFVFPLFGVWLVMRCQAPVCEQDGWRWAKIAQSALFEDGFYGVKDGAAVWAIDVEPFNRHKGETLY